MSSNVLKRLDEERDEGRIIAILLILVNSLIEQVGLLRHFAHLFVLFGLDQILLRFLNEVVEVRSVHMDVRREIELLEKPNHLVKLFKRQILIDVVLILLTLILSFLNVTLDDLLAHGEHLVKLLIELHDHFVG